MAKLPDATRPGALDKCRDLNDTADASECTSVWSSASTKGYFLFPSRFVHSYLLQLRAMHAELCVLLGLTSEALQIYMELHDWPNVVQCYRRLGKLERAETLIREQLERQGLDARDRWLFMCLLGDITVKPQMYEEAWKVRFSFR